jgi:chloride channel protein, CIC family
VQVRATERISRNSGTVPAAHGGSPAGNGSAPAPDAVPGLVTHRHDPQALFASESLSQALRQLEVYGRDGLPALSPDGQRVEGWVTGASVLRALARHVTGSQAAAAQAQAAADPEHGDAEAMLQHPPAPLPGYQVIEVTIPGDSPAAGRKLGDLAWPPAATLVSVLCGRRLRPPDREITLSAGDRVSLLIPVPQGSHPPHPDGSPGHTASHEADSGSGSV